MKSVVDIYQRYVDAYEETTVIDVDDYYDLVNDLEDLQYEYDTLLEEQTEKQTQYYHLYYTYDTLAKEL